MKTLSTTRFYGSIFCVFILGALVSIAPVLYLTDNLALKLSHTYTVSLQGVGSIHCTITQYRGLNYSYTVIKGTNRQDFITRFSSISYDTKGLSTNVTTSGYTDFGLTVKQSENNSEIGTACLNAGHDHTIITTPL